MAEYYEVIADAKPSYINIYNFQVGVSSGVAEFIKSLKEAVQSLHDVVHEIDTDFLSSQMAELKLYKDAPDMVLVSF